MNGAKHIYNGNIKLLARFIFCIYCFRSKHIFEKKETKEMNEKRNP